MMARVRILAERRAADEISTVSGESSAGSQNQSSGSHNPSRSSRRWRSNGRRSHHRAGKTSSSSVQHDNDCRGQGVSDGGSSSSSRPSSRRSSRSNQPDAALAQAWSQSTAALTTNQTLCSQLQVELSEMRHANQVLTEANQANQANNALLARRLQLVEQGVVATPMGSSSGIRDRLTPQAPSSVVMNQTEVSTPSSSGPPKRMRVRDSINPSSGWLQNLQQSDTDLLASIQQGDDAPTDEGRQVTCDPTEESTAPPTILPVLEPEPTNLSLIHI